MTPSLPALRAGLAPAEVIQQRQRHGSNVLAPAHQHRLMNIIHSIVVEPMFVLLVVTAGVYQLIGSYTEAWVLLIATAVVAGISLYQEARTDRALQALQQLTQPRARVRRAGS